jgi:tetratricopeptide (TPR) repeat protein
MADPSMADRPLALRQVRPGDARDVTAHGHLLVGRGREMDQLDAALTGALAGRGRLVVVTGEPGIGKTALARAFVERAAERGAARAWGTCWEGGGAPAYWPWVQIARALLRREDVAAVRADLGNAAPWIAGLLPELAGELGPPAEPSDLNADQVRFRLFDALATLLGSVAGRRPLVIVLDDLHWADASSVHALEFLGRALPDLPIVAIAAYRHSEAHARAELGPALGGLARAALRLPLEGLDRDDVGRLASARVHGLQDGATTEISQRLVAAVHDASAGNPFFADELLALLASQGRLHDASAADGPLPLPEGVRDTLRRRLEPLGERAKQILRLAAVLGAEFRVATLARIAHCDPGDVLERLDPALRSGLVVAHGDVSGFAFAHALVRDTLLAGIGVTERARMHVAAAEALALTYGADVEPHLAEIADHFLRGASEGGATRAVAYAARAAQRAIDQFAYEEAARLWARALDVAAALPADDQRSWQLHHGLGEALMRAGDIDGARRELRNAGDHARRLEDPEPLARSALASTLPGFSPGVVEPQLVESIEEATALVDAYETDDPARRAAVDELRARLRVQLAVALFWSPQIDRRRRLVDEAFAIARGIYSGEQARTSRAQRMLADRTLAFVLAQGFPAGWDPDTAERGLPISVEALELCERTNDLELAMQVRLWRINLLLELDDPVRADAEIETYSLTATQLGQPRTLVYAPLFRAFQATTRGQFVEAQGHVQDACEPALGLELSMAKLISDGQLFFIRRAQGRHYDDIAFLRGYAERFVLMQRWRLMLVLVLAETGSVDEARKELDELAAHDFEDFPRDAPWLFAMSLLGQICVVLDDRERARLLYDKLAPYEARNVISVGAAYLGPVARYLGLLAMTLGESERALGHLETARAAAERMGAPPMMVETALDAAEVLTRRGAPGDAARARALVERAAGPAASMQMDGAIARAADIRARLPRPEARRAEPTVARLRREGDVWLLDYEGRSSCVQDAKGMHHLAVLLASPGTPIAATRLAGNGGAAAERAGGARDAAAQQHERAVALREDLEEARAFNDPERIAQVRAGLEELAGELATASAGTREPAERARLNVTRALRTALARIGSHEPELGLLLQRSIRTGSSCVYVPDPAAQLTWEIGV